MENGTTKVSSNGLNGDEEPGVSSHLPYFFRGHVVHGFGRGGRALNCPTANLEECAVAKLPAHFANGVYAGFARLGAPSDGSESLVPMVMSVGFNVQFHNEKKTMEVHILRTFENDFYGSLIEGVAVKYLRPMRSFESIAELVEAIELDKRTARSLMDERVRKEFQRNEFFSSS